MMYTIGWHGQDVLGRGVFPVILRYNILRHVIL